MKGFLGSGGRKRVYLAHDTKLDRDVAFALIKTEGLDADGLVRARREAQAMGRLGDHPHIVTVFDTGEDEPSTGSGQAPQQYIVSQYMSGGSLEDLLSAAEDHRLPIEQVVRIVMQVCKALEHAHSKGIIHRDLKPGNVWFAEDESAQLGDFGLAVSLQQSRMTMEGVMVGTVAYMAPEQALGGQPDARSDLYSLGAMLYEMVCGRPPFLGDDAIGIISQHINIPPVAASWHNQETPKALDGLLMRLLAKSPDERPQSAELVRGVFESMDVSAPAKPGSPGQAAPSSPAPMYARMFVGREAELKQLKEAFDECASGEGSLAMVVGEPGIGKTSLCEQLATYAAVRGGRTLVGHCYEEGSLSVPYLPFIEALRSYVLAREPTDLEQELGSGAAEVARIVSEVRERVSIKEAVQADPEEERYRLLQAVTTFLRNAGVAQPLCIVLEDLHDADRGTLDMLTYLARTLSGTRLLVIGTYRDVEVDRTHPLAGALVELRRSARFRRVALRGLNADEVRRMLSGIAGQDIPWGMAEAVHRQTEGNPLFVQEVTRFLAEEGLVTGERGHWRSTTEQLALSIPEGLRDVIGKRLTRLSADCNQLLATAAVIGREFVLETLRRVSALPEEQLIVALEEAVRVGVLEDRSRGRDVRYRFAHAFFRQSLYEELIAPRRIRLHQEVARALEEQYAGRMEEHAAELAEHFSYSSDSADLSKSVHYSEMAAERAAAVFAHSEAAAYYQRAMEVHEVLDPAGWEKRCDLLLLQAASCRLGGDMDGARAALFGAADIAGSKGDHARLVAAADASVNMFWIAGLPDPPMNALLEEALAATGPEDRLVRARLMSRLAIAAIGSGQDVPRGRKLAAEAVSIARESGDLATLRIALSASLWGLFHPDQLDERLKLVAEIETLAESLGDPEAREAVTLVRAGHALFQGNLGEARRWMDRHAELVRKYRLGLGLRPQLEWQFELARLAGRFDEAERLLDEVDQSSAVRWRELEEFRGAADLRRATLNVTLGRLDEIPDDLGERLERYSDIRYVRAQAAAWHAHLGQLERARATLALLSEIGLDELSDDSQWAMIAACLTEACVALQDRQLAGQIYPHLLPYAGFCLFMRVRSPRMYGPADRYLGLLATLLERWDDAERHFEAALQFAEGMPSPPILAEVQCDFAEMLLQRGRPADKQRSLSLLTQSGGTAGKLGMKPLVQRVVGLKARAQGLPAGQINTSIDAVAAAVQSEHPDLRPHAAPDGTVTIMFSDIEGSTEKTDRLGDKAWMEVLREHNKIVRRNVKANGGFEVKSEGDGFMLAFQSARKALQCAIDTQRAFAKHNETADPPVLVRMGLHAGETIKEGDDFFGKNVILAQRIAGQAKGGEILVSSLLKELTASGGDIEFGDGREVELKGLSGSHRVFEVVW